MQEGPPPRKGSTERRPEDMMQRGRLVMKKAKRKTDKKKSVSTEDAVDRFMTITDHMDKRITRLERMVANILNRTQIKPQGTTRAGPAVRKTYMSMQWHRRDGNGYGRPPYVIDNTTGYLRPSN